MILNEEKEGRWHYLTVKKLSTLLPGITSTHKGGFYFLNFMKKHVKIKIFVELQCYQKRVKYQNNTLFMLSWNLNQKNRWMLKNEDLIFADFY